MPRPDGQVRITHYEEDRIEIASEGGVEAFAGLNPGDPIRLVFADGCQYELRRLPWKPAGWADPDPAMDSGGQG